MIEAKRRRGQAGTRGERLAAAELALVVEVEFVVLERRIEGAEDVVVIPSDFGWSDVGDWSSLSKILPKSDDRNIVKGIHLGIDTHETIIFGETRLIATIGLKDLIIVDTDDALLVCHKNYDQKVKELVNKLKEKDLLELI